MITLKCKMCGGDLHPEENATTCECEYCGSVQTIPTADNEKKGNLFNRANRLRMAAEYDKAAAVYTSITAEFPEEAEAYWGLCLCKYGIEYVEDPATAKKIPTCHRTRSESIMDDPDFDQACENADAIAKRVYREEAKAIDRLQQDILSVVANESPYDVFICYKETDEEGQRTEDSVLAQDIYDALTAKGLKVFFARITLEDKLGQQYEPYIYAALHSAKVMLAIGTQFEYYDAVWVKNEWARFLDMMKSDKTKTLIPCYKGIDAYDMPREFKNLQAQDMGKLGWLQDLTRGVMKLCEKDGKHTKQIGVQNANNGSAMIDSLLRRASVFIDDKKWDDAREYADKVLDMEVENGQAYLIKLMADLKITTEDQLQVQKGLFDANENYQKIVRFGDSELKARIVSYLEAARKINDSLNHSIIEVKKKYERENSLFKQKEEEREKAEKVYRQRQIRLDQIKNILNGLRRDLETARGPFNKKIRAELEREINDKEQEMSAVQEMLLQDEAKLRKAQEEAGIAPNEQDYIYEIGNAYYNYNRYEEAYEQYRQIRGYKDVDRRIKKIAAILPNINVGPDLRYIIEQLSQCQRVKDMIIKLDSMGLSHDDAIYKQIIGILQTNAYYERVFGNGSGIKEETVRRLNALMIEKEST